MRKVQAVVVAPNIEQIESEGGLDDLLASILEQADQGAIPVVFALSRKKLGQVSCGASAGMMVCSRRGLERGPALQGCDPGAQCAACHPHQQDHSGWLSSSWAVQSCPTPKPPSRSLTLETPSLLSLSLPLPAVLQ